jgi:hypothetical protein
MEEEEEDTEEEIAAEENKTKGGEANQDEEEQGRKKEEGPGANRLLTRAPRRDCGPGRRNGAGVGKRVSPPGKPTGDYRGVSLDKPSGKWVAGIHCN